MKKIVVLLLVVLCLCSCTLFDSKQKYSMNFLNYFDTVITITAYMDSEEEFTELSRYISKELKKYHELFDIYNEYEGANNLKTLNDSAGKTAVELDEKIIDLLLFSKEQYEITNGETNIAFGSVLKIWSEYREKALNGEAAEVPAIEELEEANKHTDINKLIIDQENLTAFLEDSLMSIDVGAIAKGFAADEIKDNLKEMGYESVLINMGGSVSAVGLKPDGEKWNVGVRNYTQESDNLLSLEIENESVVSSGDDQRFYEIDGKIYHHIIDKDTLLPAEYFKTVVVIAEDSAQADSLSTALFCMDYESGLNLVNMLEVQAIWVISEDEIFYS